MNKQEMIKACEEHFEYWDIVKSETREIIDWNKIIEFVYNKLAICFLGDIENLDGEELYEYLHGNGTSI